MTCQEFICMDDVNVNEWKNDVDMKKIINKAYFSKSYVLPQ